MLDYLKKTWPEVTFQTHEATRTDQCVRHRVTLTMPNTSDFLTEVTDHGFIDVNIVSTNTDVVGGYTQATITIWTRT
jgi:hypothetical protein